MQYKSSKAQKINHNECSSYGGKLLQKMISSVDSKNIESYYKAMGKALDKLYASRDIEFACRDFIIHDLRKHFIKSDIIGNDIDLELLKYHAASADRHQTNKIYVALSSGEMHSNEGLSYPDLDRYAENMAHSVRSMKKSFENKPKEVNSIWFANKKLSTEKIDVKSIVEKKNLLSNEGSYKYILWTNNKQFIPESVKKLEKSGVEIRSIYTLKEEIISKIEDGDKLFVTLEKLIDAGQFGVASDLFRYIELYIRGGVYVDDNLKIMHQISSYYQAYDFFTGDFQNNFITAKSGHIILKKTIEAIANMFKNSPDYLDKVESKTLAVTYYPFVRSIIKYSNEGGNIDFYDDYYDAKGIEEPDPEEIKIDPSGIVRWSKNDVSIVTMEEWKSAIGVANIWSAEQDL